MSTPSSLSIPAALAAAYEHLVGGHPAVAETICRQILDINAREPDALHCLALVAFQTGRLDAAIELVRSAIASSQPSAHYLNDLGTMLRSQGKIGDALSSYRQARALDPARADVHYNLANALREGKDLAGATISYAAAVAVQPDFIDAYFHLGNVLAEQGRIEEAVEKFLTTLSLHPNHAGALYNLANARSDQGRLDEAVIMYRKTLAINPDFYEARSNLLWTLQYMNDVPQEEVFAEAMKFADVHEAPLRVKWTQHRNSRDPQRRLKVGYVSADFRRHSVAYFAESLLEKHDRTQVEVFCYYNNEGIDAVTRRFMALADHWIPCRSLDDAALAACIRDDGIDILVDLAGHTAHHRLLVFSSKPAPVQVTYLGYPATTGLSAIDYRITDVHADPPDASDSFYTEHLIRLPETFLCYQPPDLALTVRSTPALHNGYITFGSFNALPKITSQVIGLWARTLINLPTSRMLLKAAGFENAATRDRFLNMFDLHGVAPSRISFMGKDASFEEHLVRYHEVDIGLDPFPYNGTTTTLEAMWMGVPIVTLRGDRHATRVGASLLANVALGDLIATSEDMYMQIASGLASDIATLDGLRTELRGRLTNSTLVDSGRLAKEIESVYRQMWRVWCNTPA